MLKINKENNSIVVEGLDNAQYPHDGNLVFPLNSLMMVLDESDIVTFRSAANADTVFGGNINEIEIGGSAVDKDSIVAAWESVANAPQGGGSDKDVLVNGETRDSSFETFIDLMTEEGTPDNVFSVNVKNDAAGVWNDVAVTGEYSEIYAGTEEDTAYVDVWNNGQGVEIYAGHNEPSEVEGEDPIETSTTLKVMPDGVYVSNDGGETKKKVLVEGEGTVKSVNGVEPDENGNVEIEPELSKSVEIIVLEDEGFGIETGQYYVNDLPPVDDWNVYTGQNNGFLYNVNYFITSDDTKTLKATFGDGENPEGYSFKISTKLFVDVDGETKVVDYETPIGTGFNYTKKIADLYPFGEQYEPQLLMIKQDIFDADGNLVEIWYNDASEYTHLWEKETVISTDVDGQTVKLATKDGVIINGRNDGAVVISTKEDEEGIGYINLSVEKTDGFYDGVWVDNQYVDIYTSDGPNSSVVDVYPDHIELNTDTPEGSTHLTVENDGAYISNDGGVTKKRVLTEDDLAGINELLENLLN